MPGNISEPREAPRRPDRSGVMNSGFLHNDSVVNSKFNKVLSKKSVDTHCDSQGTSCLPVAKTVGSTMHRRGRTFNINVGRPIKPNVGSMDRLRRLKAKAMK